MEPRIVQPYTHSTKIRRLHNSGENQQVENRRGNEFVAVLEVSILLRLNWRIPPLTMELEACLCSRVDVKYYAGISALMLTMKWLIDGWMEGYPLKVKRLRFAGKNNLFIWC